MVENSEQAIISWKAMQFHVGRQNGKTIMPPAENHRYEQQKNQLDRCPPIALAMEIENQKD